MASGQTGKEVSISIKIDGKETLTGSVGGSEPLIDGGPIPYLRVEKYLNAPDSCVVQFSQIKEGKIDILDQDFEGKSIVIEAGIGRGSRGPLFVGEIAYVEPHFTTGEEPPYTEIGAYDHSHRLTRGTRSRTWGDGVQASEKVSDVASNVISSSMSQKGDATDQLSIDKVDASTPQHAYVAQVNQNDYQFMRRLGYAMGRVTDSDSTADDKKVRFAKIDPSAGEVVTICREAAGQDQSQVLATNMRLGLSAVRQVVKVIVRGWNQKEKKNIVGIAESSDISFDGTPGWQRSAQAFYGSASAGRVYEVVNQPVDSKEEADAVAQAIFNGLSLDFVTGEATFPGRPGINPGDMAKVDGKYGGRFGGKKFLITGVIHTIDRSNGFLTTLQLARNAIGDPTA